MKEIDESPQALNVDKQKKALIERRQKEESAKQQSLSKDEVEVVLSEADKLRREGYQPLAAYYKDGLKVYKMRKPKESKK